MTQDLFVQKGSRLAASLFEADFVNLVGQLYEIGVDDLCVVHVDNDMEMRRLRWLIVHIVLIVFNSATAGI